MCRNLLLWLCLLLALVGTAMAETKKSATKKATVKESVTMKRKFWAKYVLWYLIGAMFVIGITPRAFAGFSPSEATSLAFDRSSDLEKVRKALEMKMVRERLKEFGFTSNEIEKRLTQLSDEQLHQLALQLDEVRVAGDGWTVLGIIIVLAAIAVIVIYMSGHRVVIDRQKEKVCCDKD